MRLVELFEQSTPSYDNWDHDEAVSYSKYLEDHFGPPDEFTNEQTVWHNKDGFKRIVCKDEYILHGSPAPHYDFVYSYIDLEIPENLSDELAYCSGSILIDHLKNEVGARCGSLTANAVTLNFCLDVVAGRAEPTKQEYERRILSMKKMFDDGKKYSLDWWPDEAGDADPANPYYKEPMSENLRAWFGKGKQGGAGGGGWDAYNSSGERIGKCGDTKGNAKPKCLSKSAAAKLRNADKDGDGKRDGKAGIARAVKRKRAKDPNKNRRGKARNVSNESLNTFVNEEPAVGNKSFSRRMPRSPTIAGWSPPNTNNNLIPVTYIGPNATSWDENSARQAQEMERDGATPEKIWRDTRTIRGVDGAWRQEIDDSNSRILIDDPEIVRLNSTNNRSTGMQTTGGRVYKADEVFDHEELYDAYPELRDFDVVFYDNREDLTSLGFLDPKNKLIGIGSHRSTLEDHIEWTKLAAADPYGDLPPLPPSGSRPANLDELRSFMAHELAGHGVQQLEPDFETGGQLISLDTVNTWNTIKDTEFDFTDPNNSRRTQLGVFDVYQGYAGEIDARSIQQRLDFDDNDRRQTMPRFDDSPIIVTRQQQPAAHLANNPNISVSGDGHVIPDTNVVLNPNYSGDRTSVREPTPRNTPPVSTPTNTPPRGNTPRNTPPVSTPTNVPPIRTSPPGGHGNPKTTRKTEDIAASAIIRSNKIFNEARKKLK